MTYNNVFSSMALHYFGRHDLSWFLPMGWTVAITTRTSRWWLSLRVLWAVPEAIHEATRSLALLRVAYTYSLELWFLFSDRVRAQSTVTPVCSILVDWRKANCSYCMSIWRRLKTRYVLDLYAPFSSSPSMNTPGTAVSISRGRATWLLQLMYPILSSTKNYLLAQLLFQIPTHQL